MKAYYLLAPLSIVALAGCAYESVYTTPAPTAYVAPAYVAPSSTVIVSAPSWRQLDSDGDGWANGIDRWPYDARFH
jgi:hypothetical protein